MDGLGRIAKSRQKLEERLNCGLIGFGKVELATYHLLSSAVSMHQKIIEKEHAQSDETRREVIADARWDSMQSLYECMVENNINPLTTPFDQIKPYMHRIAQAPILEDHLSRLREQDSLAENELEEEKIGYIVVIGYDPNNSSHRESVDKEVFKGSQGDINAIEPERKIKGSILQPTVRERLLTIAYRDGAILLNKDGEFIDGRNMLRPNKMSDLPPIRERFPRTKWPQEINYLTEHGMDPRVGTRNPSSLGFTYKHPETVTITLSSTGEHVIRRFQNGTLTNSNLHQEAVVADAILKTYPEIFYNKQ